MMKTYLILLLFICISSNCLSQINEIGFFVGGSNYVGDVGANKLHSTQAILDQVLFTNTI